MNKIFFVIGFILSSGFAVMAQTRDDHRPDTLKAIGILLGVCNSYQQLPLQLSLQIDRSSNLPMRPEDSMRTAAVFYLQQEGAYIRMGELEQVVNDSLMLLVSTTMKRMILYPNRASVASQLKKYLQLSFGDSSIARVAARFRVGMEKDEGDSSVIELTSRAALSGTALPKEVIRMSYRKEGLVPIRLIQTERQIDLSTKNILEKVTTYTWLAISHKKEQQLPVSIRDRIGTDQLEGYRPVKAYSDFVLIKNF